MKYTNKQLFVHRIAGTTLFGLSPVFVYAYTSLAIVVVWKPYFLFPQGFKIPVWKYWRTTFLLLLLIGFSFALVSILMPYIRFVDPAKGFLNWILYAVTTAVVNGLALYGLMYAFIPGMRLITARLYGILENKFRKRTE